MVNYTDGKLSRTLDKHKGGTMSTESKLSFIHRLHRARIHWQQGKEHVASLALTVLHWRWDLLYSHAVLNNTRYVVQIRDCEYMCCLLWCEHLAHMKLDWRRNSFGIIVPAFQAVSTTLTLTINRSRTAQALFSFEACASTPTFTTSAAATTMSSTTASSSV